MAAAELFAADALAPPPPPKLLSVVPFSHPARAPLCRGCPLPLLALAPSLGCAQSAETAMAAATGAAAAAAAGTRGQDGCGLSLPERSQAQVRLPCSHTPSPR
jgi:hypothetical protein